jgi:hypothetical protein
MSFMYITNTMGPSTLSCGMPLVTDREISCEDDVCGLQADLDQLQKWSDTWLLKFHPNKYKVMTVSNKTKLENKSSYHLYNNQGEGKFDNSKAMRK